MLPALVIGLRRFVRCCRLVCFCPAPTAQYPIRIDQHAKRHLAPCQCRSDRGGYLLPCCLVGLGLIPTICARDGTAIVSCIGTGPLRENRT
jgi:hypothetical protein